MGKGRVFHDGFREKKAGKVPTRCPHQHNRQIYSQLRTASCRSQLFWGHQCPVSGTLALSAGQAGPRLRARSGPDGEGKKAEEEERPREKIKRSSSLGLGLSISGTGREGLERSGSQGGAQ